MYELEQRNVYYDRIYLQVFFSNNLSKDDPGTVLHLEMVELILLEVLSLLVCVLILRRKQSFRMICLNKTLLPQVSQYKWSVIGKKDSEAGTLC